MNKSVFYYFSFIVFLLASSCYEEPVFSEVPEISLENLVFKEEATGTDSLILSFYFEDKSGDIGLDDEEDTFFPYHPNNFVIDSRDVLVSISDKNVVAPFFLIDDVNSTPPYANKVLFSDTDIRPAYDCENYSIASYDSIPGVDTIYSVRNEFYNNLHLEFFRKRNGVYSEINFGSEFGNCSILNFNGRIPIYEPANQNKPLSGTFTYAMQSAGFGLVFRNDTIKINFYIYDRALNKSNVVETPDFLLADITQ